MKLKWWILIVFVVLYVLGIVGAGMHTYSATPAEKDFLPIVETIKIVFIMLGGLGVILPTYLNVWQSLETAKVTQDQIARNRIENTFRLLERWDDKLYLEARRFTRELKDEHHNLSATQIKERIKVSPELRQSVILLFNYFDTIRVSIEADRVCEKILREQLGTTYIDIHDRFKPWIETCPQEHQNHLKKLTELMRSGS